MPEIDARTIYAAERTLLAWIRTGLAMMGFGFVVARFSLLLKELIRIGQASVREPSGFSLWIGTGLVVLGVGVNIAAGFKYASDVRQLNSGQSLSARKWNLGRVISVVLSVIGLIMAIYLIRLS